MRTKIRFGAGFERRQEGVAQKPEQSQGLAVENSTPVQQPATGADAVTTAKPESPQR